MNEIIAYCDQPRSLTEIITHLGLKHRNNDKMRYIDPLNINGVLEMTLRDKPNSRNQRFVRVLS